MNVSHQPMDPGPAAWNEILPPTNAFPGLEEHQNADVVIIGGGFAGLAASRRLLQLDPNCSVVLLEARRIAEGPAGRNSGFMIDLPHNLTSSDYAGSADQDQAQTRLNREAIQFASDAATDYSMPSEAFVQSGKINAAATAKGIRHNLDYAAKLEKLGEPFEILDAPSMAALCGSTYYQNGLFTPGTALIQPALYVRQLANGLAGSGAKIFENSPVTRLDREDGAWRISTQTGSISAVKVILAVNGHAESFGLFKRRIMHVYLYASMTRALNGDEIANLKGNACWAFTPADAMGTTVRKISGTGGHRIVVRNGFTWAPERAVSDNRLKKWVSAHDKSFAARFPQLAKVSMEYRWGGLLCLSRNAVPAFGEQLPGLYAACCQNGLGTAMGTLSGKLAAELALGHPSQSLNTMLNFDEPKRLPPEPFAGIGANVMMHWSKFRAGAEF